MTGTVLLIGASRGLGLGLARAYLAAGWRVIATQRSASALADLAAEAGDRLVVEDLDMTDDAALVALRTRLAREQLDLLFVNAGIMHDKEQPIGATAVADFTRLMVTNALAPMRVIELFADLVVPGGVVGAMTSTLGSVAGNTTGGYEVYRASKAALNTLLRSYSCRNPQRPLVALHPGWVRTDMGGEGAAIEVAESVPGMVAALAGQAGKPGCVYIDYRGETISW